MSKKTDFLKVFTMDGQTLQVYCPNPDRAVLATASYVVTELMSKANQKPLDFLLGVVVHVVSMDTSGGLEKAFLENLEENVPKYREMYKGMEKQMKKPKS